MLEMLDMPQLAEELKRDEGFEEFVYDCSAGYKTIGYGHNLETTPFPEYIAEKLLHHNIAMKLAECERFPWFYELSDVRKRVIINMVYNIGGAGVLKFRNMIAAINAKDWELAADEMMDSNWYNQVGDRAVRLVNMMRYNESGNNAT